MMTIQEVTIDSKVQIVPFTRAELDTFHVFRLTRTCLGKLFPRADANVQVPKDVWENIFRYLSPKDLFTFFVTAKEWSVVFDVDLYRNQFVILTSIGRNNEDGYEKFISLIDKRSPDHKVPLKYLESTPIGTFLLPEECALVASRSANPFVYFKSIQIHDDMETFNELLQNTKVPISAISSLRFSGHLDLEGIKTVLEKIPKVESLSLNDLENIPGGSLSFLATNALPFLKMFRMCSQGLRMSDCKALFEAAPNLVDVCIEDSFDTHVDESFSLKRGSLMSLRSYCHATKDNTNNDQDDIPRASLDYARTILKAAPNLEKLELDFSRYDDCFEIEKDIKSWLPLAYEGYLVAQAIMDDYMRQDPKRVEAVALYYQEKSKQMYEATSTLLKRISEGDQHSGKKQKTDGELQESRL